MTNTENGPSRIVGVIVLVGFAVAAWSWGPVLLEYKKTPIDNLSSMFASLLLASLVLERAIEVFLSAWRSRDADLKDMGIQNLKDLIEAQTTKGAAQTVIDDLQTKLEGLMVARVRYSADSRFIAQWLGLGMGILIAFVGIRVLGNLVTPPTTVGTQQSLFTVVDIILTGAVLAGGSDAINKIMKLYNSFISAAAQRAKEPPKTP